MTKSPENLLLDSFQIYNLFETPEDSALKLTGDTWTDKDLQGLGLNESFLALPWNLQKVETTIVCYGRSNGTRGVFVPNNSVVQLKNHRGQVNMGWNEQGVVDPTGRFIHNNETRGSSWPEPGWFNAFCFVCAIDTTDNVERIFLRNSSIPAFGGASLDAYWSIKKGGSLKTWCNDDYKADNSGRFSQEIVITPFSAFKQQYHLP